MIFHLLLVLFSVSFSFGNEYELSDDFIDYLNSVQTDWVAGRNFDEKTTIDSLRRLTGTIIDPNRVYKKVTNFDLNIDLPENFDAREKWGYCKSISDIRNQAECGSCYAVSATSAMSDRICISTKGEKQTMVSAIEVVSCSKEDNGCSNGTDIGPYNYWISHGIVDGGDYGSKDTCMPYPFSPCSGTDGTPYRPCSDKIPPTPPCEQKCQNGLDFSKRKSYGESYHYLSTESAMAEIFVNGSITASFYVYSDLANYKSGVYSHKNGRFLAGHAVRVIGWGVENGIKYWLVTNSWGEYWGDKGLFKIKRGVNECNFEDGLIGVIPKLP